jgi:hypothetical protein
MKSAIIIIEVNQKYQKPSHSCQSTIAANSKEDPCARILQPCSSDHLRRSRVVSACRVRQPGHRQR